MHKYLRYGFVENIDTVRHVPLGKVWRVEIAVTPLAWLFPFVFLLLGLVTGPLDSSLTLSARFYDSLVFMIGVAVFTVIHAVGHLVGGKLVGSSMDELLFTATRGVNIYAGDQASISSRVHLGRALGGPIGNVICAVLLYRLLPFVGSGFLADVIASAASTNLIAGVGSLLPLPSLDGQVIWRELLLRRVQSGRET